MDEDVKQYDYVLPVSTPAVGGIPPIAARVIAPPSGGTEPTPTPTAICEPQNKCEAVTVNICEPQPGTCKAFCEFTKSGAKNCEEVCTYDCDDFTFYEGYDCYVGCVTLAKDVVSRIVDPMTVSNHELLNCVPGTGCIVEGGPKSPSKRYYSQERMETQGTFCSDTECTGIEQDDLICLESTTDADDPILIYDDVTGESLQCRGDDDLANQFFNGDNWCPEGFEIVEVGGKTRCISIQYRCAGGFVGNLDNGCDDLFDDGDDYWNLYDASCFQGTSNVYDKACCLKTEIAGFQLYDWDSSTPIRVY